MSSQQPTDTTKEQIIQVILALKAAIQEDKRELQLLKEGLKLLLNES